MFLLAVLFVILNILDIRTTRKVLSQGGYEANPPGKVADEAAFVYTGKDSDGGHYFGHYVWL